jgi:hypothetical protein
VSGHLHAQAALAPGKDFQVATEWESGWAPEPVPYYVKMNTILPLPGLELRTRGRPACSQSPMTARSRIFYVCMCVCVYVCMYACIYEFCYQLTFHANNLFNRTDDTVPSLRVYIYRFSVLRSYLMSK